MKPLERIPILANVLIVACERPATEVGKLVKAVVAYATKGVKPLWMTSDWKRTSG